MYNIFDEAEKGGSTPWPVQSTNKHFFYITWILVIIKTLVCTIRLVLPGFVYIKKRDIFILICRCKKSSNFTCGYFLWITITPLVSIWEAQVTPNIVELIIYCLVNSRHPAYIPVNPIFRSKKVVLKAVRFLPLHASEFPKSNRFYTW